jgi:hypothetical protein
LIYGDSGVGKTTLLGTAMDHEDTHPMLLIDIEGGVTTLRKRRDLDVKQIRSIAELEKLIQSLQRQGDDLYYKCIGLDSITELQKKDMRQVMADAKKDARDPDKVNIYVPGQREWGISGERVRMIVRALRDLPCHFLATALKSEEWQNNPQQNTKKLISIHPNVPGKLRSELPGFFDIVGLMRTVYEVPEGGGEKQIIRTLQVSKTDIVTAKDRTDTLPQLIKNPSIPLIWETIHADDE